MCTNAYSLGNQSSAGVMWWEFGTDYLIRQIKPSLKDLRKSLITDPGFLGDFSLPDICYKHNTSQCKQS